MQGVGFRPFVYRLARRHSLRGWVLNAEEGVDIHVEGGKARLNAFLTELRLEAPPAAGIADIEVAPADLRAFDDFEIRSSTRGGPPTVRITPDLPVCQACLSEMFDAEDQRYRYPYINCTECGPRFSIILGLPYDREQTTMKDWAMCADCARAYEDPADRRFHAQPVACPACGPLYVLYRERQPGAKAGAAIGEAVRMLRDGMIVAVKGLGGYHLACDAQNEEAVRALRRRKYRKEKPFALMTPDLESARGLVVLSEEDEAILVSTARPIVLASARRILPGVAPDNRDIGIMLPYTPLHYLLFDAGAPTALVMTSANRSSEPIAYRDDEAFERLDGLADAFLVGERPIARRVDDSVARSSPFGAVILRRARGYAPGAAARLPASQPILALGADLKNTVTLAVDGQAFVSQHIGDLDHYDALQAFQETVRDLLEMYDVDPDDLLVVHDRHPQYASKRFADELPGEKLGVQHHRAHIASVTAEREAVGQTVVGFSFDGTGFGDDGSIWGGEVFAGSVVEGFRRVAHLQPAVLPGGDAAAKVPVQAAAGFLHELDGLPDLKDAPFGFPDRYEQACELVRKGVRTFPTTSVGRLFDTVAALLGFTREMTFEGQAAIWLEHLARSGSNSGARSYPFPDLDFRPLLTRIIADRARGVSAADIARAFHRGIAHGLLELGSRLCEEHDADVIVVSGGVFQNQLLLTEMKTLLEKMERVEIWTNRAVPPNDGGISLGQAAMGAVASLSSTT